MPIRYPENENPGSPGESYRIGENRPPGPKQWNTTPMWQDPYNPPSPGDPYWDEWIAANPDYAGPMPVATPAELPPPAPPPPLGGPAPAPTGTSAFDYELPGAPTFEPPGYTPPPAFAYQDFVAPTGESVLSDPGYQFRKQQGEQALLNNRAARGLLNTGGTLKDFLGYNQNFATQEYGNVWDRAADAYRTNRSNAVDVYNTNYKTQYQDPFDISYKGAQDVFGPRFDEWKIRASDTQHQADERRRYSWLIGSA